MELMAFLNVLLTERPKKAHQGQEGEMRMKTSNRRKHLTAFTVIACAALILAGILLSVTGCAAETAEPLKQYDSEAQAELNPNDLAEDYTEIFRQACPKLQEEDIGHISALVWRMNQGMDNTWMAADFEKNALYGGIGHDLECCGKENLLKELTEDDRTFINETIATAGMTGWDNLYIYNGERTMDGNFEWTIGIRLDSGVCIKYEGSGWVDPDMPESVGETFCQKLWEHFTKNDK